MCFELLYSMELIIYPDPLSEYYLDMVPIDMDFKLYLAAFAGGNIIVCELIERFLSHFKHSKVGYKIIKRKLILIYSLNKKEKMLWLKIKKMRE